jgi:hypothetical protein
MHFPHQMVEYHGTSGFDLWRMHYPLTDYGIEIIRVLHARMDSPVRL